MEKIQYQVVESKYCSTRPFTVMIVGEGYINPVKGRYSTRSAAEKAKKYFTNKK